MRAGLQEPRKLFQRRAVLGLRRLNVDREVVQDERQRGGNAGVLPGAGPRKGDLLRAGQFRLICRCIGILRCIRGWRRSTAAAGAGSLACRVCCST
jgi:hypothetical protein